MPRSGGMKARQSPLAKAASVINRISSGQPSGRKESDSPSKIAAARKAAAARSKKIPPVSKSKRESYLTLSDKKMSRAIKRSGG